MIRLPHPEKGFFRALLTLAAPMMLQNLITFAVGFADNIMVGSLGEAAISGVYLGNQPQNLLNSIVMGIDSAMLIIAAQYWGKKDTDSIKHLGAIAAKFALLLGLVFSVAAATAPYGVLGLFTKDSGVMDAGVDYLKIVCWSYLFFAASQLLTTIMKSVEHVKVGMYAAFISLSVNVVLNYVFIFGKLGMPAMGVAGAALATLISRIIEFSVAAYFVFFKDKRLALRPADLLPMDKELLKDFAKYGAPVVAGQIVWGLNNIVQSSIIGSMGAVATTSVSICGTMHQMCAVTVSALSGAVGITTGKLVGAGKVERVKNHAKVVQLMFLCLGFVFCSIILSVRSVLISFYNISPETQELARKFLTVLSITYIGTCYQGMSLGSLVKAGGDTRFVFINDTIFVWGVVIPLSLLMRWVVGAPAWVVYACLKADEVLKCAVAYFKINSFNWIKNLTRSTAEEA